MAGKSDVDDFPAHIFMFKSYIESIIIIVIIINRFLLNMKCLFIMLIHDALDSSYMVDALWN